MKIYLGTDHAGFDMKEYVKSRLMASVDYDVIDLGAHEFCDGDDYPDFITPVAQQIAQDIESYGIIFGGSGQGEAMVANRFGGVRCAVYYGGSQDIVTLSRQHNNANMLSIGARFMHNEHAYAMIELWLTTSFAADTRHVRRLAKF